MSNLLRRAFRNATTRVLILVFGAGLILVSYFLIQSYYSLLGAYEEGELSKLKGIIYTLAPQINGDDHLKLTNAYPNQDDLKRAEDDSTYLKIQGLLQRAVASNMLKEDAIYTMLFDSTKNEFEFAVFSRGCYWRHKWNGFDPVHASKYTEGSVVAPYEDENGIWLSAFIPLLDSKGNQVGIIQVDSHFDTFIAAARRQIGRNFLITFIAVLVIGIFIYITIRDLLMREEKAAEVLRQTLQELEITNRETIESIEYARRIQDAILPSAVRLNQLFGSSFVIYQPRDIVSGDFFWMAEQGDWVYIAAVDCTGHGVPGAFMSIIGSTFLGEIVKDQYRHAPAAILDALELRITAAMNHDDNQNRDGMDIGLVAINRITHEVEFAGALRPLIVTGNSALLQEIRADRFPIGGGVDIPKKAFVNHALQLKAGDSIYLFTDGFADQMGGPRLKRIGNKRLKEEFERIEAETAGERKMHLENFWQNWRGNEMQIDDVLLIGITLT